MALTKISGDILKQPLNVGIITATSINVSGISTLGITSATNLTSQSLVVSGISTLGITSATNLTAQSLVVSGISTFTNGPILVGSATSTGTASQRLQVTGGAYVSGSVGIGTTNPQDKLEINSLNGGDVKLRLANSASSFNNFSIIRSVTVSDSQSKLEFQVNNGNNGGIQTCFIVDHEGVVNIGQQSSTKLIVTGNSKNQDNKFPDSILNIISNTALAANAGGSITLGGITTGTTTKAFGVIEGYKENATASDAKGYLSFLINTGSSILEALRITSAGSVGIGTTNPTSKLHVVGDVSVSGVVTATTFIGAVTGTATSTTNIPNLTGAIISNNTTTSLGSFTSANLATALTDETGSGSAVFANTPTLITPVLGIATATNLTSQSLVVSGITTFAGTFFATENVILGSLSAGYANHQLQVTGNVYVSANVGIGTPASTEKLSIYENSNSTLRAKLRNPNNGSNARAELLFNVDGNTWGIGMGATANNSGAFYINENGEYDAGISRFTVLIGGNIGIGTTNPTARLSIGPVSGFQDTITTVATTAVTTIDSFATGTFRSTRAQVQITQSTNYQASDVLIIHDGTTASIIEYGSIATNDYLGTFSASVSGGNCLLQINMSSATSATVKVLSQRITI